MRIEDSALVLSVKPLSEGKVIITLLSKNYGIYSGVSRLKSKSSYTAQPSDEVHFVWQARLHEHIGVIRTEIIESNFFNIMQDRTKLLSISSILLLIKLIFQEREEHINLFTKLKMYINHLKHDISLLNYIKMELEILNEAGYQLTLDKCAVSGLNQDLMYVSPKSGKSVSKIAGEPYKELLLKYPSILTNNTEPTNKKDIEEAFILSEYFLKRYVVHKELPNERDMLKNFIINSFEI